jgi:hypothetical protein
MACRNCSAKNTIKAHLIPQGFIREVRGGDKGHALTNRDISSFQPSQNGRYDDDILCAACDNRLGQDENYALQTLASIRKAAPHIVNRGFVVEGISGDRLLRFAAGIVWKYALTKPHYGGIKIGPYTDQLRHLLFGDGPGSPAIDAFLMKLHTGDDEPYFYRAPSPERYEGLNFVRFSVGGFIFLLKLDQRSAPSLPSSSWLRANTEILIPAIPFDKMEEGRLVQGARRGNERLDAYLERVSLNPTLQ